MNENTSDTTIIVNGVEYAPVVDLTPSATQIVIAQRGWIFVGEVTRDGDDLVIVNAKNIRTWGTSKGLGELVNGPTSSTKVDDYGTVRLHHLAVVARLDANPGAWK